MGAKNPTVKCTHFTTQNGIVATSTATLDTVARPDPVDNSGTDVAQHHLFVGTGRMDTADPSNGSRVTVGVDYPARSRYDDILDLFLPRTQITLQVAFTTGYTTVTFMRAQWDISTGRLDAINDGSSTSPIPNPGSPPPSNPGNPLWVPQIHCTNFYFLQTKKPFICDYSSNRTPVIHLSLHY